MKEISKGFLLFISNWILVAVFYYLSILVVAGNILQKIFNTRTAPEVSIFVNIFLIVFISYFLNKKFVKAKKITFIIAQSVFGISALVITILALQAVARGIMMNA